MEGNYTYAVSSIRRENGQESESARSAAVQVNSDSSAPDAPENLTLALMGKGVSARWDRPSGSDTLTFNLYRSSQSGIHAVSGIVPVITSISGTAAVDPVPSDTDHCYVVTALDEAGNESGPSNFVYLEFELLPISGLSVVKQGRDAPVISWSHPGATIIAFDIYLGTRVNGVKLNDSPVIGFSFMDAGHGQNERTYTVVALDAGGHESPGRSITLPVLDATLPEGETLGRGVMSRLDYVVKNNGPQGVENVRLKVFVNGLDHYSQVMELHAGAETTAPVVVGGYPELQSITSIQSFIEIIPNEGEKVEIIDIAEIRVLEGMPVLQILNEEFTRGGSGAVRFTLENTGEADLEIITALAGGYASDQIRFYLTDRDDNVLSSVPFNQRLGGDAVTLPNGNTIVRIAPGAVFTSEPAELSVPENATDDLVIRMDIDHFHHRVGYGDQVTMEGAGTSNEITIIDTVYYGEIQSVSP